MRTRCYITLTSVLHRLLHLIPYRAGRDSRRAPAWIVPAWIALAFIVAFTQPASVTAAELLRSFAQNTPPQHTADTAQNTYRVNTTDDPGAGICDSEECTLREAILAANIATGSQTIQFDIPGDGPHTIMLQGPLPVIVQEIHIDGTTQPGYTGTPLIELDGSQAGQTPGLVFTTGADFSRVQGLAINRFEDAGIQVRIAGFQEDAVERITIENNYIGVGPDGVTPRGNGSEGIAIIPGSFNNIHDNWIGANGRNGIYIAGATSQDNVIARNYIGTNPAGDALGNGADGILAQNSGPQIIGGTYLTDGCCEGNTIAFNQENGVAISAGFNASYEKGILGNRIFANGGLGIDLQRDGVTENDADDSDGTGMANRLQNYPVLDSAQIDATGIDTTGGITITGVLTSTAETDFRIEFFANDACDDSGHGEGQRYLGGERLQSDEAGLLTISTVFTATLDPVAVGNFITATATDLAGNTSEFSACIPATGTAASQTNIFLPVLQRE